MKDIASESFEIDTRDYVYIDIGKTYLRKNDANLVPEDLRRKSYPSVYQLPYGPGARVVGHTEWTEIGFGGAGPQYVPAA